VPCAVSSIISLPPFSAHQDDPACPRAGSMGLVGVAAPQNWAVLFFGVVRAALL
jgi:hypothetical protein